LQKNNVFKIGAATVAAAAGAILAITSVGAHTGSVAVRTDSMAVHVAKAPALTGKSAIASMIAGLEAKEAAIKLAAAQKKAALLAARLAKLKADAAAEAAEADQTPTACQLADQAEDANEKLARQAAEAAEHAAETTGTEDAAAEAAEKAAEAAEKATDATEDSTTEVKCPATGQTETAGQEGHDGDHGSVSTFSSKHGDH
jgi:cobalamin biosynthesis protein CobT